jgi:integrase/recombinase XerD
LPAKLTTTIKNIESIPNLTNIAIVKQFHQFMIDNGASERHQNNNLKTIIAFAKSLDSSITFHDIQRQEQILGFLNTKIKPLEEDPDKKWIVTWNDYLHRIKHFLRWLYNQYNRSKHEGQIQQLDWQTPTFAIIKEKKTKRLTSYSESEIWDRDELLTIVKYEPYLRNKTALTLFWDLDARNHEVTMLKIKNIRLKESYGEGEIPYNTKTGGGPILLTCSFPYVRDWLNRHPFKNSADARLICNLHNGAPVRPEAMWTMMKQLRNRIVRMLENGSITDHEEREKLQYLLKTKKWNPYCLRHSSISSDSDFLPEYALKKKVRWSMNSKQGARYIKTRMSNDLKRQILIHNGIISESEMQKKPSILSCPRCSLVNAIDNKYCSKCSYPLVPSAFDEIKAAEDIKFRAMEERFNNMQSQLQTLITALGSMQDQNQINQTAQMLYKSGILNNSNSR